MKILFFSHIYSDTEFINQLVSMKIKLPGVAVSNYEMGFLSALKLMNNVKIQQINREFLPFLKDTSNFKDECFNKKICGHKCQDLCSYKLLKKNKDNIELIKNADVIFFSTYHDWRFFKYVKKINDKVKCFLILPDLPNLIINKSSLKHKMMRRLLSKCFYNNCKYIDGLIPITEHMGSYMKKYISHYIVIEGVVKEGDINSNSREGYRNNIVYSGGLSIKYGVLDLLNAFIKSIAFNKYNLVICGKGECEKEIIAYSNKYENIKFLGFIPRKEVLSLISEAAFLVMPENPKNEYSKYSFHSKIIEYLGSGTPVIGYLYPGIPKDYNDYFLAINDSGTSTENDLITSLNKFSNLGRSENIVFGEKAKQFISNKLSPKATAQKILSFIEEVL